MRWSIVGLVLIGLIAALCVAMLFAVLRGKPAAGPATQPASERRVVLAAKAIDAKTIVKASDVTVKTVPAGEVPKGSLANPAQVIGKVLAVDMVEGEAFTKARFATEGSGLELASTLREGQRAVSVSLSDYSALAGLLYPGSIVDVLVSVKHIGPGGERKAVSTTLLQGIQVLGVGDHTIFSEGTAKPESDDLRRRRRLIVTLLVNSEQAQKLQLADEYGSISLAMRNPTDGRAVTAGATMLTDLADPHQLAALTIKKPPDVVRPPATNTTQASPKTPPDKKPKEQWETVIIRGPASHTEKFPMPN